MVRHDHIGEILAEIDAELERPPIPLEECLQQAVIAGRMTIKEAEECYEAYNRTYNQILPE